MKNKKKLIVFFKKSLPRIKNKKMSNFSKILISLVFLLYTHYSFASSAYYSVPKDLIPNFQNEIRAMDQEKYSIRELIDVLVRLTQKTAVCYIFKNNITF